ncbi:hypothetical protein H8R18_01200 [Nanchangia anserum]|uniref:Uncharacterized protein n=1 Tax=Nanchangia anserum TaxID=2692125 RepID=A0A8I0KQD2_9ACTO|nr:hypothetical protein [Nanchangia anserum]MBD3689855.1 hypothetical protein [Nanchangia anserum]QOX82021.1 hypothetical protein H8R18_01200 [Nanchangia anserum]
MTNEITIYTAPLDDRLAYAGELAKSSLLPEAYRGKPANVLVAVEAGQALGVSPMQAIQSINVIKGRPALSAEFMSALVRRAGHKIRVSGNDERAEAVIIRSDDPDYVPDPIVWTMERAQRAGLTKSDAWRKYPAAMLKARAISEAARTWAPDAISGFSYTPEEVDSFAPESVTVEAVPVAAQVRRSKRREATATPREAAPANTVETQDAGGASASSREAAELDWARHMTEEHLREAIAAGLPDDMIASGCNYATSGRTNNFDDLATSEEYAKFDACLVRYLSANTQDQG